MARKLLLRLSLKVVGQIQFFGCEQLFTSDSDEYHCNERYLADLPADENKNVQFGPFSKALAQVLVPGTSDGKYCLSFLFLSGTGHQ
jgi:hypothetical protein